MAGRISWFFNVDAFNTGLTKARIYNWIYPLGFGVLRYSTNYIPVVDPSLLPEGRRSKGK